ncbi:MAG: biopolymer transporter ExbD [Endomicrobium sp.]|jgi:biopolymer transport protein ExbD|nr:biopolymer transporter ExbD [Endomicrobium sp.]
MHFRKKRDIIISEINITPFTDVVLVLLIIFMLTTHIFVESNIKIELPKARNFDTRDNISNIKVLISKDENIYIDWKQIHESNIENVIRNITYLKQNYCMIIKCDKKAKYSCLTKFMDKAKKAGITKFFLDTDKVLF